MYPATNRDHPERGCRRISSAFATGTLNFFRSLGGAIIVAAFAAIVLGGLDAAGSGLHARQARDRRFLGGRLVAAVSGSSSSRLCRLFSPSRSRRRGDRGAAVARPGNPVGATSAPVACE